ncbi:MAG: hypothetical protein GC181_13270 [Bacteroidetes bacterium]|nr:hypothetical protein [Bacteroidota bacterium]
MAREFRQSGFSNRAENEGHRLINKDGSFNVEKTGLRFFERFSLFHWLIHLSLLRFVSILFATYLVVNAIFAIIYMLCGPEAISGPIPETSSENFLHAFFFSTQTLTTVGYGSLYPISKAASLVASVEAFLGLLGFAMATGLLYGRFSRPKARILFSNRALIAPYRDGKGLMIRLANAKESQITNLSVIMTYSELWNEDGEIKRKFFALDLEIQEISALVTSWTLVHPVNEDSPLWDISEEKLKNKKSEIIIHLRGYDETYSQIVQTRASFTSDEIILNARFRKILGHNEEGKATIDLSTLSDFEVVSVS